MPLKRSAAAAGISAVQSPAKRPRRTQATPAKLKFHSQAGIKEGKSAKKAYIYLGMAKPLSTNSNTSTAGNVKTQVGTLNQHYNGQNGMQKYSFIIGHLVNEQLENNNNVNNFVPLTSKANSEHKNTIESPIVKFLTNMSGTQGARLGVNQALDQVFSTVMGSTGSLFFSLYYEVKSSSDFWHKNQKPDCFVPNYIEWQVQLGIFDDAKQKMLTSSDVDKLSQKATALQKQQSPGELPIKDPKELLNQLIKEAKKQIKTLSSSGSASGKIFNSK